MKYIQSLFIAAALLVSTEAECQTSLPYNGMVISHPVIGEMLSYLRDAERYKDHGRLPRCLLHRKVWRTAMNYLESSEVKATEAEIEFILEQAARSYEIFETGLACR